MKSERGKVWAALAALLLFATFTAAHAVPHTGHCDTVDHQCLACRIVPGLVAEGVEAVDTDVRLSAFRLEPSGASVDLPASRPATPPLRGPPTAA